MNTNAWLNNSYFYAPYFFQMSCESLSKSSSMLSELERKITERDPYTDESPYEKIELFWPIEMLKVLFLIGIIFVWYL